MTPYGRFCLVLSWLCLGCGARSSLLDPDLTMGEQAGQGGQPRGPMPGAGTGGQAPPGSAGTPSPPEPNEPIAVRSVAVGGRHSCAVLATGLKCWGTNFFGVLGLEDLEGRGDEPNEMGARLPQVQLGRGLIVERVVPGSDLHTCALLSGGRVKCWGDDDFGQLGLESFIDRGGYPGDMGEALPFVSLGVAAVVEQLAIGSNHSCAILSDDSLKCWGNNSNGQLGLGGMLLKGGVEGDMGDNLPAVDLAGARVIRAAAASVHTCAILEGGSLRCWGWERGFEDPPTTPESPLTLVDLGGLQALDVAAGGGHSCVHLSDQSVRCWAVTEHASERPQLLPAVDFGTSAIPQHLGVGGGRGCALLSDASVRCWPIGDSSMLAKASPIQFGTGRKVVQMSSAGARLRHHGCALLDDGSVKCWGENAEGQLGVGDVTARDGSQPDSLVAVELGTVR